MVFLLSAAMCLCCPCITVLVFLAFPAGNQPHIVSSCVLDDSPRFSKALALVGGIPGNKKMHQQMLDRPPYGSRTPCRSSFCTLRFFCSFCRRHIHRIPCPLFSLPIFFSTVLFSSVFCFFVLPERSTSIFFVTNNSTKSRKGYKKKFDSLGLVSQRKNTPNVL